MFKEIDYNKNYVIGTPLVAWKSDRYEDLSWIEQGPQIMEKFPNTVFFTALELDHRGLDPFENVINELQKVGGTYWTFTINDNESKVTTGNRLIRIETGRNLVREFAQRKRVDAVLYVDSDISLSPVHIEKLFEIDRPLVGIDVPQYGLKGNVINENPRVEEHWTTAGMLLVNAPAYYDLPWSHNTHINISDDPTFQNHAARLIPFNEDSPYGMTWVRKDLAAHHNGFLAAVEDRHIKERQI